MTPVFIINLARSADRRAWMEAEVARVGAAATFIRAVDGRRFSPRCEGRENLRLAKAEAALILSHRKVWRAFLSGPSAYAVVLEDDVHLGRDFAALLALDWRRWTFDVVKLETMFDRVWWGSKGEPAAGRTLHRLGSEHMGAAGYLISRDGARKLLTMTRALKEPVDHTIFGERVIFGGRITALQLSPGAVVQDSLYPDPAFRRGIVTTLHEADRKRLARIAREARPKGLAKFAREARRLRHLTWRWLKLRPSMSRRPVPFD